MPVMPRLARRAGIEKRVHAHGLCHTHAAELALQGHPMNLIQAQLEHTSLATTSRYLAHIALARATEKSSSHSKGRGGGRWWQSSARGG